MVWIGKDVIRYLNKVHFYEASDIPNNAVERHFSNTNLELVNNKDNFENNFFAIASYHNRNISPKS